MTPRPTPFPNLWTVERRRCRVYVASKSELGPMLQMFRDDWAKTLPQVEVVASWIDMSGPDEGLDWPTFIREAGTCDVLLAVHRPGDVWKGAFVEIGAALASNATVIVMGDPPGSWKQHPNVTQVVDLAYDPGFALVDYLAGGPTSWRHEPKP